MNSTKLLPYLNITYHRIDIIYKMVTKVFVNILKCEKRSSIKIFSSIYSRNEYRSIRSTVRRLYFATLEVRFILSLTFQKLSLAFNLGYLSQVFINFNNQWQFWNPHDKQISNLSLIFEFAEELTEIIDNEKDEDEIIFWKISTVFNLKHFSNSNIKESFGILMTSRFQNWPLCP